MVPIKIKYLGSHQVPAQWNKYPLFFKYGPIPASFVYFRPFRVVKFKFNLIKAKHRCCAWDSNMGPQNKRAKAYLEFNWLKQTLHQDEFN